MQRSMTRIRTSHVGRLPPFKGWEDVPGRLASAEITDSAFIASQVTPAIAETVRRQVEAGIDCIGDGEFWTARSLAHYTAHFTGIEARPVAPGEPPTSRHSTRERDEFSDFYADMDRAGTLFLVPGEKPMPPVTARVVARGPVRSKGPGAINRQLDSFKAAIERSGAKVEEAFVAVLAPGWLDHAEARTDDRGLPQICQAAHRCRQPRARRHPGGKGALPFVLGQLARPAHP